MRRLSPTIPLRRRRLLRTPASTRPLKRRPNFLVCRARLGGVACHLRFLRARPAPLCGRARPGIALADCALWQNPRARPGTRTGQRRYWYSGPRLCPRGPRTERRGGEAYRIPHHFRGMALTRCWQRQAAAGPRWGLWTPNGLWQACFYPPRPEAEACKDWSLNRLSYVRTFGVGWWRGLGMSRKWWRARLGRTPWQVAFTVRRGFTVRAVLRSPYYVYWCAWLTRILRPQSIKLLPYLSISLVLGVRSMIGIALRNAQALTEV